MRRPPLHRRRHLGTFPLRRRHAFSLVEMVMVIAIIGMISSMAIPRISQGATGATDAALAGDLAIIRRAINFYAAEHNGNFPGPSAAAPCPGEAICPHKHHSFRGREMVSTLHGSLP